MSDPGEVRLLPGAAEAILRFAAAGHLVVVVSNQSGVARGIFDEDALAAVHDRVEALLGIAGVKLDGSYYCPYLDGQAAVIENFRRDSELRKPKPGMLIQAARDLDIDLARSWMIGDSARDVEAGYRAGCRTIRIAANGAATDRDERGATYTVRDVSEAANVVERAMQATTKEQPLKDERVTESGDSNRTEEVVHLLTGIHAELERAGRPKRQHDFSALRLMGALSQMCALLVAVWGVASLINADDVTATAQFALACFLQLVSLSAFATDRFR